jgi:hypothetical protein
VLEVEVGDKWCKINALQGRDLETAAALKKTVTLVG